MKQQPQVTPWFPVSVTPIRNGVYQVIVLGELNFSRWSGKRWHLVTYLAKEAAREKEKSKSMYNGEGTKWRGLASDPSGKDAKK